MGRNVGTTVGLIVGDDVGIIVGNDVGFSELVGLTDGFSEGIIVGCFVGDVGWRVGAILGIGVGFLVGDSEGTLVGVVVQYHAPGMELKSFSTRSKQVLKQILLKLLFAINKDASFCIEQNLDGRLPLNLLEFNFI